MTTFEIPTLTTDRLQLRAYQASDRDAYAAMQANPEVMRYLVLGRTVPRVACLENHRHCSRAVGAARLRDVGMQKNRLGGLSASSAPSSRNRRSPARSMRPHDG